MAAKVTKHNGTGGTTEGMAFYRFTGTPTTQFEHIPAPGERRVMQVTVERSAVIEDEIKDGDRTVVRWKVIEAELGKIAQGSEAEREEAQRDGDPQLPYESGADGQYSETYGTGQPVDSGAADAEEDDERDEEDSETSESDDDEGEADPADEADDGEELEPEDDAVGVASVHQFPTFSSGAE